MGVYEPHPIAPVLVGLVQDHDCWRKSGFRERSKSLLPRAPMDFRLLQRCAGPNS